MEQFGEEAAEKIKTIIDECLKPEKSRPEMHIALNVLGTPVCSHQKGVAFHRVENETGQTGTCT